MLCQHVCRANCILARTSVRFVFCLSSPCAVASFDQLRLVAGIFGRVWRPELRKKKLCKGEWHNLEDKRAGLARPFVPDAEISVKCTDELFEEYIYILDCE